jgi:periplasmic divalent cation tolerance protein
MTTVGDQETANKISDSLVDGGFAGCVSSFPIKSVYRWEGKVEREDEVQLMVKTSKPKEIEAELKKIHPYELPEIIILKIDGSEEYIKWLQ